MAEKMLEHPVLAYLTFGLPVILLILGMIFGANVLLIMIAIIWLGVALAVLYLPMAKDDGSGA